MKHISIRVPWHDNFWNGCFCQKPSCNTFCKVLPKIAMSKRDDEDLFSGEEWYKMSQNQRPACAGENGGFMSPKPCEKVFTHVYSRNKNSKHSQLLPTSIVIPPFTALGIPFRYMSKDNQKMLDEQHPEFRPDEQANFTTDWLYGNDRQKDVLSWFRSNVSKEDSLCVFYCKNGNPIDDEGRRMVVGLGEITKVHPIYEYESNADFTYPMWEILFEHSIRQDLKKSAGFLLPYQQYLQLEDEIIKKKTGLNKEEALDEIKLSLDKVGNNEKIFQELSYGCDYVSNQSMLILLEAARNSIDAVIRHQLIGGDWASQLRWIDSSIKKVKSLITPFPAFAEALKAIGINYAYLIEQDLRANGCGNKDNPWDYFEKLIHGELRIPETIYIRELPLYQQTWDLQSDVCKDVLRLLSRFEIDETLIQYYIQQPEKHLELISNPYIICEESLQDYYYDITTQTIDIGVIKDVDIQGDCVPVAPSVVESVIDSRRLRSMVIERLCEVLPDGDTVISISEMEDYLRDRLKNDDRAKLPIGILETLKPFFSSAVVYIPEDPPRAIQLKEYYLMEEKLRSILLKRAKKVVKHPLNEDWLTIVQSDKNFNPSNQRSVAATKQQAEALQMMGDKRLSVLTGGAGTGKTTVVRSFLSSEKILNEGVLLLAPTGKARVRLGSMAQQKGVEAQTIAQFLLKRDRFDTDIMLPKANNKAAKYSGASNIIIDECSMLTTRDLYVLFDALDMTVVNRIILIGDPYQLPPIGAGRPFSDLCHYLLNSEREDNLRSAIYKLETVVRTIVTGDSDVLTFASWFSGDKPKKDADSIFDKIEAGSLQNDLRVYYWEDESELNSKLKESLCDEFNCTSEQLGNTIKSIIGTDNPSSLAQNPEKLERLQILSPVINPIWGTLQLNDDVQRWLGNNANGSYMQFSSQKIYDGDKVIQLKNEWKDGHPSKKRFSLANGQIGFVYNIYKSGYTSFCNVSFVGIPNERFGYRAVKGEDSDSAIELSYAITIHKSQGSDFNTVLVVLPKSGRILSRELIYTALTRAKSKIILLIQDNINWLRELTKPQSSALARRNSNLFEYSVREQKTVIPFVEGLIHRTKADNNGLVRFVRSKSEVIIANELISAGIRFDYEKLIEEDGRRCIPDFSFSTDDGDTIIWEHLGMLGLPEYRASWERKKEFYHSMGYIEGENLFTTEDHLNGSIDSTEVIEVINRIKEAML